MKNISFKYLIKLYVFPLAGAFLNQMGMPWKKLGRSKLGREVLIAQVKKIKETLVIEKQQQPLNIYFLTMLGGHTHNVSVDVVLGLGLKKKGHQVHFVLDDLCLPINEDRRNGQEANWDRISAKGFHFGKRYLNAAGLDVLLLSELIDKRKEVDIAQFASIFEASLLKHYKVGVINEQLPRLAEKKKLIRQSINYTTQLGNHILSLKPDRVIMSHGIYSTWGPPFEILNEAGIPILTYSKTKRKKTEKFNWNYTADWWDVSEEWVRVKDTPLTSEQEKKIDEYLETRITHKDDVLVYNFGKLEAKTETLRRFKLNPDLPVFSLFTNVLWDAASAQREIAFDNPVNWVYETIDWFIKNPHLQLIVKIHPAEVVIGTNQPFADLIKAKYPNLPPNICLIEPAEKVNSWSIYEVTDLGLVHTTTAGMEMPLVNVPCVVVSKTHYRDKGFTVDIQSKEEYFSLLDSFKPGQFDMNQTSILAKRYAYLLFERYQMPFEVFDEIAWTDVRSLTFNTIDELFEKPYFDAIIDAIIEKGQFLTN